MIDTDNQKHTDISHLQEGAFCVFLVKLAIASIPALFILSFVAMLGTGLFSLLFNGLF